MISIATLPTFAADRNRFLGALSADPQIAITRPSIEEGDMRWRFTRRIGGFGLSNATAERLEGVLCGAGNRVLAARLALMITKAHRSGRLFALCRRGIAAAGHMSERQARDAIATLATARIIERIGGGSFDRTRGQRSPIRWRLAGWLLRRPKYGPGAGKEDLGPRIPAPPGKPVLGLPVSIGGALRAIPSGGELAAVRQAARQALDRMRGAPLPGLSAAMIARENHLRLRGGATF
jgi:hypothetical protein